MATITYVQGIQQALAEELERDPATFYMGEDVGAFGGAFGMTKGLQDQFGRMRVRDTPLSETLIVGAGVGAALAEMRPIVELQFADFFAIAMDEIYNKAAKWRYMHGGLFKMPLTIIAPEGAKGGAGAEHSQSPSGMFWSALGMHVMTPATPADAKGMLKSAIRNDNPVLFLPHKGLMNDKGEVPDGDHLVPIGEAAVRREGDQLTIVAWSVMVGRALEAADILSSEGVSVEVIDARGVRPFDFDTVLQSVEKTGRLVLAHEAPVTGGPGSEVAAVVAERGLGFLEAPIERVGSLELPIPQSRRLEKMVLPTTDTLVRAARRVAAV